MSRIRSSRNPYPREQIDLVGSRERQELLEEIVSQPGQSPSNRRFLVPVGIAAALAIVAGGAWFVTTGDDGSAEDQTAAASSGPTPEETATDGTESPTADPTDPDEASPANGPVRLRDLEEGDVIPAKQCRQLLRGDLNLARRTGIVLREEERDRPGSDRSLVFYLAHQPDLVLAVDRDCTVVGVDVSRRSGLQLRPRRG